MARLQWIVVLLVVGSWIAMFQPGYIGPQAEAKERKSMDGLVIGTFPKLRAVLPGESLFVDTVFENPGPGPVDVPNSEGPSPFAYDLLKAAGGAAAYEVSQDLRDTRRARDIAPPQDRPPQALAAGETLRREEDLAEMHNEDFAPGKYLLRARVPYEGPATSTSASSPFTVLVPRVESFSSGVCGNRKVLSTVYAHRREDGGVLILQRESLTDPREGVAFRRIQLPAGPATQVAVALDAMVAGNGRWFGWLRDGVFEAAVGWGNRVIIRAVPAKVGDAQSVLLSPGFQVDVGVGLFGFVLNASGPARLKALRASAAGLAPAFETELSPQAVRNVRWNYRADAGITVFWEDASGQLLERSFDNDGKPLQTTRAATGGLVPLAWDLPALGEPALRAVVRARDGRFLLVEPATGGTAPLALPAFSDAAGTDRPSFSFCRTAPSKTKVVAVAAGKVWSTSQEAGGFGAWQVLSETHDAQYLHAFSPRGRTCWAEWIEKGIGTRRVALP
jgi:hypothetical protein